jgi:thiamine-phosphate pyrophosphorylase
MIDIQKSPLLCLVTDRNRTSSRGLEFVVGQAMEGGANMIQCRDRDMENPDRLHAATKLREITEDKALFIVNGDVDLAKKVGADGIHFPEKHIFDADTQKLKENFILGQSVHSLEMATKAELLGIDYLIVGTLFPSKSHPHGRVSGTKIMEDISGKLSVPLIGIGGISSQNCRKVIDSGASGVAVIGAISEAVDPRLESQIILENISVS